MRSLLGVDMIYDSVKKLLSVFRADKPVLNEVAAVCSPSLRSTFMIPAYSPDDLVSAKGLAVYDEMQKDAQIRSSLNTKKFAVLSDGWKLMPDGDSPKQIEIAEFVNFCLDSMDGSVQDMLFNALDAVAKGYSILEINYRPITSGKFAGKIGIASVKSKDPALFGFELDDFLNITGLFLQRDGNKTKLPRSKFIVYTYMPSYEMPYGQSDLRAAYKHYYCKSLITNFWNMYLEKFGMPTARGSYKRGMTKDQQNDLLKALDKIQQETAIVIPEDVTIELIEAKRNGEAGYLRAIEHHNKQISKAILGQTLTSEEGSKYGSFAMAKVHMDVFKYYIQKLKRDMEETVMRDQLIKRLVDINYAEGIYPVFTLDGRSNINLDMMSSFVEKLVSSGIASPDEGWIRDYLGIPREKSS